MVAAPVSVAIFSQTPTITVKTMTLASARVVKISKTRYLLVRVNGAAKTAKLRITLVGKSHGKITRQVVTRTVTTNSQVRVPNLKVAPSIRSVKVALA